MKITCYDEIHHPICLGSGFFIDSNTIVTNYHVIENASSASITLSDFEKQIIIDGYYVIDTINDLAILSVSKIKRQPLKFYNKKIEIGSKIYSIGSPEGLEFSISDGLVSQLRNSEGISLIQITAPISHGSSGCPILLESGEVVGVAVASLKEGQNLNFAIPYYLVQSLNNTKGDITYSFKPKTKKTETYATDNHRTNPNQNSTLITFSNGKNTSLIEFESVYRKSKEKPDAVPLNDYLELFLNFKMKVMEAEELGMDNTSEFKKEMDSYRKQLAQPYLTDMDVNEKLLRDTYYRLKTDIRASHILVAISGNASPNDTLEAFNKIINIRKRITNGEDFNKVAMEKGVSDDPSAKDNGGDLGYFTALQMIYEFETVAYNTKIGEVSQPVRTRYGYHIIKVMDRRPAQGEILVSHIMVKTPPNMSKEDSLNSYIKIIQIYDTLNSGKRRFNELAQQYSDDKQSAKKGGELPWFGTNKMPPEFEKAAFTIKNKNDYSPIIRTKYGWHIIKLMDKRGLATFDEMKNDLKLKVTKDSRAELGRKSIIAKLKTEYFFQENIATLKEFYNLVDVSIFEGNWNSSLVKELNKTMFNFGSTFFTQKDFTTYILNHQKNLAKGSVIALLNKLYKEFVDESMISFEEYHLDEKYPEFKQLLTEYRDGILLFELSDQKIWSKAVNDEKGRIDFYKSNKANYGTSEYENILGKVTADYQNYLELEWLKKLRMKYPYEINYSLLKEVK